MSRKIIIPKDELITYLKNRLSTKDIAKIYNTSHKTINLRLREYGIYPRQFELNHDYFQDINEERKAYWLGYIWADGNINQSNCSRIEISSKDISHLYKWHKDINYKNNISISYNKYGKSTVCSNKMFNDLIKLGCCKRKSLIIKFPNLKIDLIPHFIRGYFDGDGSVSISKKLNRKKSNNL